MFILNLAGGFATLPRAQGRIISLHILDLSTISESGDDELLELRAQFDAFSDADRTFQMEFKVPDKKEFFVLMTVQKEAWLRIGALPLHAQEALAVALEEEFAKRHTSQLILKVSDRSGRYLVIRTKDEIADSTTLTFELIR